jgi:flagellar hook-associated protein 3 FlgL
MYFSSYGDSALQFQTTRQSAVLKTDLARLAAEMSSGEVADKTKALGGDTIRLSGLEYSLDVLSAFQQATNETAQTLTATQVSLEAFDKKRETAAIGLLKISIDSPAHQVDELGRQASTAFIDMVSVLNTRNADRSLFAGVEVDKAALNDAEVMLTDIMTAIGTATSPNDIMNTIDTWFDDPAGGFATMGYTGDTGDKPTRAISETLTVTYEARADDPALRDVLKASAIATVADRLGTLGEPEKATLLRESGLRLQTAAVGIANLQSRVGFVEQSVKQAGVEHTAQKTALSIERNNTVSADPFETASALQTLQTQLELHYAMTARFARLNLGEYLR